MTITSQEKEEIMKKEKEYRKFAADVIGTPPLTMLLANIPEPNPGKKNFRPKRSSAREFLFQDSDLVLRLIEHLAKKE